MDATPTTPPPETPRIRAIKRAYLAGELPVGDIARAFGISRGQLVRMRMLFDWPLRQPGKSHQ